MSACTSDNYSYQDKEAIRFFRSKGRKTSTGTWLINWDPFGGYQDEPSNEYPPEGSEKVLDMVKSIVGNGKNNLLLIHPDAATILFLAEIIKPEQLAHARENPCFIEVNVVIGDQDVTIRIINEFTYFISSEDEMIVF